MNTGINAARAGVACFWPSTPTFPGAQGVFAFWKYGVECYGTLESE